MCQSGWKNVRLSGRQRLHLKNGNKSAQDIVNSLINLGDNWMSGLMNDDDITLVVIKRR